MTDGPAIDVLATEKTWVPARFRTLIPAISAALRLRILQC